MTTTPLPETIANYIDAANAHDVEAITACFGAGATVHDEGRDRSGISAIREWATEASEKYHPMVEVLDVARAAGSTTVTGRVSGDFPGSPVELRFLFTLQGEKIARLEISG